MVDNEKLVFLKELYSKNYINKENKEPKIPKIIHQVWLGSKLPDKYNFYIDTIKKVNPEWEYKLWTDDDVEGFGLKNIDLFNNIKNFGSKSDIFRYEILERFGGVYMDTDFYGVKSFNELLYLDFFAGNGGLTISEVYNGLFGTALNGKIITKVVNNLLNLQNFKDDINGVMKNTGPYFFTDQFYNNVDINDNVVIFSGDFFYPFPSSMRYIQQDINYNDIINSYNTENTICVHMWHTSWQN
jgi:mannosyltransferase OCH1-like enzyme